MSKNLSMNTNILTQIISMFDKDTELKINKIMGDYSNGYHWTFNGIVKGEAEMMKLTYNDSVYRIVRKRTQEVTEELKP